MSKISSIYDALDTLVSSTLSSHKKLANPFALEQNSELILKQAYGITIGGGNNSQRLVSGRKSYVRDFTLSITRQVTATRNSLEANEAIEKAIIEDHYKIFKALEEDSDLSSNAARSIQLSDGGIAYLDGDLGKFLLIEIFIEVEYFET